MSGVEKYYTVTETCELLSVCDDTVHAARKAGKLGTCPNIGTARKPSYRIPASGINRWLGVASPVLLDSGIAARTVGELRRKAAAKEP